MATGFRKTARAALVKQTRNFADAMGANTQLEKYILGNGLGRVDDPDNRAYFLARKDEDAPVESFTWSGQGAFPVDDGSPILVGWFDGQRRIIGPDVDARIAQGSNPKTTNSADTRLAAWNLKDSLPDFSCQAIGTVSNPSTKVLVYDNGWIDESYQFRAFLRTQVELAPLIPGAGLQRLAMVAVRPDFSIQTVGSTPKSTLLPITPADVQECVNSLYPRAIPVAFWLLANGQTAVTPADRYMDARWVFNTNPPRTNYEATTDPTVTDDLSKGYGVQSKWTNTTAGTEFTCVDATVGAAVWTDTTAGNITLTSPDGSIDITEPTPGDFELIALGSAGADTTAIHDNVASEIHAITEETTPDGDDEILIESALNSYAKRRLKVSNLPASSVVYPNGATIHQLASLVVSGNAFAVSLNGFQAGNILMFQSPGANGDTFENRFYCRAGTFTLKVIGTTDPNRAIQSIYIDGVLQTGTIDWYSAGSNVFTTKTLSIDVLTGGEHVLRSVVTGRNASNVTGYNIVVSFFLVVPSSY